MAICKHCGTEIEDGLKYCPNCGQSIDDYSGDFFEPDEGLEEEAYNIFDAPDEFDMDSLLEKEFGHVELSNQTEQDVFSAISEIEDFPVTEELFEMNEKSVTVQNTEEQDNLAELLGLFGEEASEEIEDFAVETTDELSFVESEESDFLALDDLFQDLNGESSTENKENEAEQIDHGLEELLAVSSEEPKEEKKKKEKKQKKEKQSFFQTVFGNVPVDPSKIKEEPTPEQIAAKKQKEAEEKKAKAEEKKLAAEEKKQSSQRNKEEKSRQKALAKEEKKAKKMQEAKLILEEMKETRINRVGATIVFLFFAVVAIVLLSGSDIFGYAISIHSAEDNFDKACNNNVKYYNDAYNDIYGLEIKPEDQVLSDKIMTVMFVNKELNSYNSQMLLGDYEAALHSLVLGLYRYGKYYETNTVISLGITNDLDYVRTQILKELNATFHVSEDEAEVLRSMLEAAGVSGMNVKINEEEARIYNLELYEIVKESGLNNDSNN